MRSSAIRKKLILEGSDLTLAKCLDIAHTYELSLPQAQAIGNQTSNGLLTLLTTTVDVDVDEHGAKPEGQLDNRGTK